MTNFTLSNYTVLPAITYNIFNNENATNVRAITSMSKQRKITNDNLICSEDATHVLKGNRTLTRKDAEAIRRYINGEHRNIDGVKTLTTKPITHHVIHNNVKPDLFINDGSRMIVGVYLHGEYAGLAKLAYLVGRTWKIVNGSINCKTDPTTGSTYHSITFYALQPPLTESQSIAGSKITSGVSLDIQFNAILEFCISRGFDPDAFAMTQLRQKPVPVEPVETIEDLLIEITPETPMDVEPAVRRNIKTIAHCLSVETGIDVSKIRDSLNAMKTEAMESKSNGYAFYIDAFSNVLNEYLSYEFNPVDFNQFKDAVISKRNETARYTYGDATQWTSTTPHVNHDESQVIQ